MTLVNSPTLTTDYLGEANNAYDLNGTDQYMYYNSFPVTMQTGTVIITLNVDTFKDYFGVFELWDDNDNQRFRFLGNATGIRFYPYRDNVDYSGYRTISLSSGWVTIGATIDSDGVAKTYKDGILDYTISTNYKGTPALTTNNLYIGNDPSAGARFMDGQIAQIIMLDDYAMTEEQFGRLQTLLQSHKLSKQLVTEAIGDDSITGLEFFGVNDND